MNSHQWTFLSNHAHVITCLSRNPKQPLREVAVAVGITERAVQRIISELESAGYIEREKVGRQNAYTLHRDIKLRHPLEEHITIGDLLRVINKQESTK